MPSHRMQRLDAVVARLQLRYGPRAIGRAASPVALSFPHLATTFAELDAALAIGGLPQGRISEISGSATSGKVTLAAKVLASAHRAPETLVAWVDLSKTCDPDYLHRCGLDLDRLLIIHPADRADALAITLYLIESNTLAALVFDGLADLLSPAQPGEPEFEGLLAGTLERVATTVTNTETAAIFLSEPQAQFRTLAHLATVRLELCREHWIRRKHDITGYEGKVTIAKHKLGPAGAIVPIRITFDGTVQGHGTL